MGDEEIKSLKQQISNLNANIDALKAHHASEIQALQQKIGSTQQQIEIENENFMKQNNLLEYKYNKKEADYKKLHDTLYAEKEKHRKIKAELYNSLERIRGELKAKNDEIEGLEQNLDMLEAENMRLKEYEEDVAVYEAEMEDIDEHYQKMLDELEDQQEELNEVVKIREEENQRLKGKVHEQSESIADLQSMLDSMQNNTKS